MDYQRHFGKELTNILDGEKNNHKRNYSYLHGDRVRDHSLNNMLSKNAITQRQINKTVINANVNIVRTVEVEKEKSVEEKFVITDIQMVPEYFFENLQYLRQKEK
jgi:hypothetical protein